MDTYVDVIIKGMAVQYTLVQLKTLEALVRAHRKLPSRESQRKEGMFIRTMWRRVREMHCEEEVLSQARSQAGDPDLSVAMNEIIGGLPGKPAEFIEPGDKDSKPRIRLIATELTPKVMDTLRRRLESDSVVVQAMAAAAMGAIQSVEAHFDNRHDNSSDKAVTKVIVGNEEAIRAGMKGIDKIDTRGNPACILMILWLIQRMPSVESPPGTTPTSRLLMCLLEEKIIADILKGSYKEAGQKPAVGKWVQNLRVSGLVKDDSIELTDLGRQVLEYGIVPYECLLAQDSLKDILSKLADFEPTREVAIIKMLCTHISTLEEQVRGLVADRDAAPKQSIKS
jgi:hypothetical protein